MTPKKIAVMVGRFQNIELHEGYLHLIQTALQIPGVEGFVIIMGSSPVPATRHNPFTFEERKFAFLNSCGSLKYHLHGILEQQDQQDDQVWSNNLDELIFDFIHKTFHTPNEIQPILVCSRDSFKPYYSGKTEIVEIEPYAEAESSTESRERIVNYNFPVTTQQMIGKLKGIYSKFPTVYATVDVAIIDEDQNRILLGRKPREKKFRFPGGFSDPTDLSFLDAAKREAHEEVGGIELDDWQHVTSMRVDDWRYRKGVDKIITNFYRCTYVYGHPEASDDLAEVKWFSLDEIQKEDVFNGHWDLLQQLKEFEAKRRRIREALDAYMANEDKW